MAREAKSRTSKRGSNVTLDALEGTSAIVAQMGWEPIAEALDAGAHVVVAGRACDDLAIAAYPIAAGADIGLATHMGKILECGAFSAEPFAMDVMLGFLHDDHFVLEPGSPARRASLKSVAAHSLYEREDPFLQRGPGGAVDLSGCRFEARGRTPSEGLGRAIPRRTPSTGSSSRAQASRDSGRCAWPGSAAPP